MFYHAFDGYMQHAFPLVEPRPLTCKGEDSLGGYALTLIDSLDTLALLGDRERFGEAVEWVSRNVRFDIAEVKNGCSKVIGNLLYTIQGLIRGVGRDVIFLSQVEYYFSDINLATTEQLLKFIRMDQEREGNGFVPLSVIASFKKIKALVTENPLLAYALRTLLELVVRETGKRVKQTRPINDSVVEQVQSRIVVAENLPTRQYKGLNLRFSYVGSVKSNSDL